MKRFTIITRDDEGRYKSVYYNKLFLIKSTMVNSTMMKSVMVKSVTAKSTMEKSTMAKSVNGDAISVAGGTVVHSVTDLALSQSTLRDQSHHSQLIPYTFLAFIFLVLNC